jgi:hypothetical protein
MLGGDKRRDISWDELVRFFSQFKLWVEGRNRGSLNNLTTDKDYQHLIATMMYSISIVITDGRIVIDFRQSRVNPGGSIELPKVTNKKKRLKIYTRGRDIIRSKSDISYFSREEIDHEYGGDGIKYCMNTYELRGDVDDMLLKLKSGNCLIVDCDYVADLIINTYFDLK